MSFSLLEYIDTGFCVLKLSFFLVFLVTFPILVIVYLQRKPGLVTPKIIKGE